MYNLIIISGWHGKCIISVRSDDRIQYLIRSSEMRSAFIVNVTRREAVKLCPWAAVIRKVDGGYCGWESVVDYVTWKKQK